MRRMTKATDSGAFRDRAHGMHNHVTCGEQDIHALFAGAGESLIIDFLHCSRATAACWSALMPINMLHLPCTHCTCPALRAYSTRLASQEHALRTPHLESCFCQVRPSVDLELSRSCNLFVSYRPGHLFR